jgi:hypothetical protein
MTLALQLPRAQREENRELGTKVRANAITARRFKVVKFVYSPLSCFTCKYTYVSLELYTNCICSTAKCFTLFRLRSTAKACLVPSQLISCRKHLSTFGRKLILPTFKVLNLTREPQHFLPVKLDL